MKAKNQQPPWDRAAALLLQALKSRRELEKKLAQWEVGEQEAAGICDRLEEIGLLNDREYAHTVVRHYAAKGFGPKKLRDELYRRGVPRDYWDEALEETNGQDNSGVVGKLLERKLRGAEPTRENLKRASDYLARRGFGWDEITEAIEKYKDAWEGSD